MAKQLFAGVAFARRGQRPVARRVFSIWQWQCYKVTMIDPLAPTVGLGVRLALSAAVLAVIWLTAAWALA